ncbi:MAG: hypothetical protein KF832_06205 [Caldilineaceae bacterium]|nr:hypothetical protein [Caldilineaceae bacterium]
MQLQQELVHDSTLVSAVDSFLKELVHVRPSLCQRYSTVLEEMTDQWFDANGRNEVMAVDATWLQRYLARASDPRVAMAALQAFYQWSQQHGIVTETPHGLG